MSKNVHSLNNLTPELCANLQQEMQSAWREIAEKHGLRFAEDDLHDVNRYCHLWTAPVLQEFSFCDSDLVASGHLSGLFSRHACPLALMKSARRIPINLSGYGALAIPRGVPAAASLIIITWIALAFYSAEPLVPRKANF